MNFPPLYLRKSDAETPSLNVSADRIPVVAQAAGHMMIAYDNPVEWGTAEEIATIPSAQRTPWAGKKELGWSGVEYFKMVNELGDEVVRLIAIPGSWSRSSNDIVERIVAAAKAEAGILMHLAHGLVVDPALAWEKPNSPRDPHRIIKTILYRSLLRSSRTIPSNSQLNTAVVEVLESFKDRIAEAKKGPEPTEAILLALPPVPEPAPVGAGGIVVEGIEVTVGSPVDGTANCGAASAALPDGAVASLGGTWVVAATEPSGVCEPVQDKPAVTAEVPPDECHDREDYPEEPSPEAEVQVEAYISKSPEHSPEYARKLLEVAKRVLPASRMLEARGLLAVGCAVEDAVDNAKRLLASLSPE